MPTTKNNIKRLQSIQVLDSSNNLVRDNSSKKQNELKSKKSKNGFLSLFRFAKPLDYLLMILGTLGAIGNGAANPFFALLWGNMIDNFRSSQDLVDQTYYTLLQFIYIGLGVLFCGWIMIACWAITGQRQAIACKKAYLKSLLRQEVGWFDCQNQFEISSRFSVDTATFQGSIGHNIPFLVNVLTIGITGMIIAFIKGWLMALVMSACLPVLLLGMYAFNKVFRQRQNRQERVYSEAGGKAEQALFSIKTVKMLNGQNFQSKKYDQCLARISKGSKRYGALFGLSLGLTFFSLLAAFALGVWYGAQCILKTSSCSPDIARQQYTPGIIFTVFFSINQIAYHVSHFPINLKKLIEGVSAIKRMSKIIDREPKIKNSMGRLRIQNFKGIIKFHKVCFSYPKDPSKKILNNLTMQLNKNKIAFVGESGCGKSTILQLLLRFYDPDSGVITVDGYPLDELDLDWWRQMIGYVGQQPVLFGASIKQNLLFAKPNATDSELEQALKKAQVWDFVNQLKKKMDTFVGSGGCQISGGQKQRISIARAIIRKPKILILDQATSALDRKNQKLIQQTLNKVSQGVISLTIAHRTKTIMDSDQIFVIQNGQVSESGKFSELKRFKNEAIHNQLIDEREENLKDLNPETQASNEEKQKQKINAEANQNGTKGVFKRLLAYSKGNYCLFFIAIIFTAIIGAAYPVSSVFFADIIYQMIIKGDVANRANRNSLIMFLISILQFIAYIIQLMILQEIGKRVTTKLRSQTFFKLMKLPIYWHEKKQNNVAILGTKLSLSCYRIKQMTTDIIFILLQILFSIISAIIIAFIFEWRTALVQIGLFPLQIVMAGYGAKIRRGTQPSQQNSSSANMISQTVVNIRTVYSIGYEKIMQNKYVQELTKPFKKFIKSTIFGSFFYGLGQSTMFVIIAVVFHISSYFIVNNGAQILDVFTVIFSLFFASLSMGNVGNVLPNLNKCKKSAHDVLNILDTKDQDQIQIIQNSKMINNKNIQGNIILKNIKYKYQSRSQYLFNDFNIQIPYGQKIALVGSSGCGKSTILSFLLRFYQPQSGQILLNGINIKDYDIHFLRSQFGVVSQQPVLFNTSFKENIKYNMQAKDQQVIGVARQASCLGFILNGEQRQSLKSSLDLKEQMKMVKPGQNQQLWKAFDRGVGPKGSHISGGQKQRIAIARAILRKPHMLLLDEATSALDDENQAKVQQCLDRIMENKSSISVSHRYSTIKNSKVIFVFSQGQVVESGTYQELMEKKKYFYELQK